MLRAFPHRLRALRSIALCAAILLALGAAASLAIAVIFSLYPTYYHGGMEVRCFGAWRDNATNTWYTTTRWLSGPGRVEWDVRPITPTRVEHASIIRILTDPGDGRKKEFPTRRIAASPAPINERPATPTASRERSIYGLPFACLSSAKDTPLDGDFHGIVTLDAWHPPTSLGFQKHTLLPTRIHWLPFVANSTINALAFFALFLLPFRLRRTLRKRRGLCPHCAYDRCATPPTNPCPECGRT